MSDAEGPCDGALGVGKVERRDVQQPALVEHPPAVVTRGEGGYAGVKLSDQARCAQL